MNVENWINQRTIFLCVAGSHAYGLDTEASDLDYRGVCVPPVDYALGLRRFEQKDKGWPGEEDRVVYGINKFVELAAKANPNIIELLFMPEDCVQVATPLWQRLVEIRHKFLTSRVKHTYSGYAFSQLKRIKSHRRWLLDPPEKEPQRSDFGLISETRMSNAHFGLLEHFHDKGEALDDAEVSSVLWGEFEKERRWRAARREWEQYQGWQKNRNPKRHALEKECGYDAKHASHCVRLLIQGLGILRDGDLQVRLDRGNREFCLAIKQGEMPYDTLMALCDGYLKDFEQVETTLPKNPPLDEIYDTVREVILDGNALIELGSGWRDHSFYLNLKGECRVPATD